ncbi:MAG: glycosyltransferase [bacterium]|nr:glycosyltransferase [bacterium]
MKELSPENNVLISVIIPLYNVEKYIKRTLDSLINQSFKDFEVIVIDDGSTDKSVSILEDYLRNLRNIKFKLLTQSNSGVSKARNKGLEYAIGKYIFFLDADDIIDKNCLAKLYFEAEANNADIVYCGFNYIDENNKVIMQYEKYFDYIYKSTSGFESLVLMLKNKIWIRIGSSLYKRELIDKYNIKFFEQCSYGEDQEFILKALYHARLVSCVPEILHYYLKRQSSAMTKVDFKKFQIVGAYYRLLKYLSKHGISSEVKELIRFRASENLALVIISLASNGYSHTKLMKIIQNKKLKTLLKEYKLKDTRFLKNFLKIKILLYFPRLLLPFSRYYKKFIMYLLYISKYL